MALLCEVYIYKRGSESAALLASIARGCISMLYKVNRLEKTESLESIYNEIL